MLRAAATAFEVMCTRLLCIYATLKDSNVHNISFLQNQADGLKPAAAMPFVEVVQGETAAVCQQELLKQQTDATPCDLANL